jgi:DNA-binding beta-propeller fold protein YncE
MVWILHISWRILIDCCDPCKKLSYSADREMMEYSFTKVVPRASKFIYFRRMPRFLWGIWRTGNMTLGENRVKCPSCSMALRALLLIFFFIIIPNCALCAPASDKISCIAVIESDIMERTFSYPSHLYYDVQEDEIYITDSGHNRIVVCSSNYFPIYEFGNSGAGNFGGMERINGTLAVVARDQRQSTEGVELALFDDAFLPAPSLVLRGYPQVEGQSFLPARVVQGKNGRLYVVSENGGPVYVFNPDGTFLHLLKPHDMVLGIREPATVKDVAVDKNGRLYLLSEQRGRVYVYDQNEIVLFKFGQKGGDRGKLARPRGIAVNAERGEIYIVDYLRHAVSIYTLQGEFVDEFGGKGVGRGWLYYPSDVAVDGKGNVLVADTFNHRIQVFSLP